MLRHTLNITCKMRFKTIYDSWVGLQDDSMFLIIAVVSLFSPTQCGPGEIRYIYGNRHGNSPGRENSNSATSSNSVIMIIV